MLVQHRPARRPNLDLFHSSKRWPGMAPLSWQPACSSAEHLARIHPVTHTQAGLPCICHHSGPSKDQGRACILNDVTTVVCRQADSSSAAASVRYVHASSESVPIEDGSLDLVAASYLLHELPASATQEVLQEAHRMLRPGAVLALIDGDPW